MIRAVLGILALCAFPVAVFAQAVPATATGAAHPYSLGGNTYTFAGAQATAANAASYSYAPAANGSIYTTNVSPIPGASGGAAVPVTVNGSISKAAAAAAIGRFLGKVVGVFAVGVAVYDLAKELGYNLDNSSGAVVVTKPDPASCVGTVNCTFFTTRTFDNSAFQLRTARATKEASCDFTFAENSARSPGKAANIISYTNCTYQIMGNLGSYVQFSGWGYGTASVAPTVGPSGIPSSVQQLTDSILARPTWPPESAIARAVRDAIKSGESVAVNPVSVTGPASVPATKTVTNNGTSTTTSQTTNNYNYAGNTVSVTNVTNSTTVNNTSGATEGQSTTTTEPEVKPDPEPDSASDTPLVSSPTLYVRKYPDGLTGVWNVKKSELLATPLLQLTSNLQPTIAAPSGYPMWLVPVVIGHWNFGTYDVSPASYVWDFLKVCTIIGALFLARALIFGG